MIMRELAVLFGMETKKEDFDKLNESIEGIKETAHRVLEVYIGEKLLHGLMDGFREFGETSREIMDAQLLGLNTTQYQVLQQGAQMFGVQRQRFNMGMALMQRNAYESMRGNKEAAMTFAQLGVNVMDNNGKLKNTQTLLYEIANGMKKFSDDPGTRMALGEKLFGMRDLEFQNLLLKGSAGIQALEKDATELGFVMGHDTVEAGEKFNRQMMRMSFIIDGLKNKLMGALAPVINDLIDKVVAWVKANQKLLDQKVKEFAQALVDVVVALAKIVRDLSGVFMALANHVGGVAAAMKFLIYSFLAMKALDIVVGIATMAKEFFVLASAIRASAAGMTLLNIATKLNPIVAFIAVLWGLYEVLKYIYNLIWGDKASAIDINAINQSNTGGPKGYIAGQANSFFNSTSNSSKGGNVIMSPRYDIKIDSSADPQAISASLKEVLDQHSDKMLKDTNRQLGYMLEY